MLESSAISFTDIPFSSAWKTTKRRSLVGVLRRVLISGSSHFFIPSWESISRDLKAFKRELFNSAAYRHDFSRAFHGSGQGFVRSYEFVKRPPRNLD